MSRAVRRLTAVAALSLAWALAPASVSADDKPKDEAPAEKIRKALDQPIDLELKESTLTKVAQRFHEKTKLDIVFDRTYLAALGGLIDPDAERPQPVEAKFKGTKVRDALRKVFEPYGLAPFIVDEAVLMTSEETGPVKQFKQRVDVDVDGVPLATALEQLGRRKAVNLVVDQKAKKEAEKKVTLQVDDVAMETAVRLLAEQAGLKAARIDNVLYVTTPEQAASIGAENRANMPKPVPYWPYGPLGPLGGVGVVGLAGNAGALGAIGFGGGAAGISGIPGSGLMGGTGFGGGSNRTGLGITFCGGVGGPQVVPPLPPLRVPRPDARPTSRAPKLGPALAAAGDGPGLPSPTASHPEQWARMAGRPTIGARRRRSPATGQAM